MFDYGKPQISDELGLVPIQVTINLFSIVYKHNMYFAKIIYHFILLSNEMKNILLNFYFKNIIVLLGEIKFYY